MKPDLDDYEDLNENEEAPRSRAMSWLVLGIAVAGFASLAYYAYHSGSKTADGDVLTVQADTAPIKTAPADAGGEQFPNKDKTIYDVIAPENGNSQQVEKLLPEPQQPVVATANAGADHEDDDVDGVTPSAAATAAATPPAAVAAAPKATPAPATVPTTTYVNKSLSPVGEDGGDSTTNKPVTTASAAPAPAKAVGEPTFVNERPVAGAAKQAPSSAPAAAKPSAQPAAKESKPKAAPAGAGSGNYKIQLGAFKSEAEAQANWKKIQAKTGLSGAPIVVQADVNGTTYYRLRIGGYASPDAAKAACASLSAKGQACILAGK